MRKILLLSLIILPFGIIKAQNMKSFTEDFDSTFMNVNFAGATTGILYERMAPFARLQHFDSNNSSLVDTSNMEHFMQAYFELYHAAFLRSAMFPFDDDSLRTLTKSRENIVDIGLLHFKFNVMDSTVAYQKLYFDADSVLRENNAVNASLFVEKNAFVAAPLSESIPIGTVVFRFRNMLHFDNTGNPIVRLRVDFDDGFGLRQISDSLITITYAQDGPKTLHFEAYMQNRGIFHAYASISCESLSVRGNTPSNHPYIGTYEEDDAIWAKITPPDPYNGGNFSKAKGNVWIYFANADKKLRKPVLIVDGFDPENDRTFEEHEKNGKSIWEMLFYEDRYGEEQHLGKQLLDKDYDLVVLDLPDGGTYIEKNAMVCIEVINMANRMLLENGSEEEIVVVGPSMGGQITRYALAYMEKHPNANTNYGNHNCRLWISFDSPHQGANISYGAQAFIHYFKGMKSEVKSVWDKTLNCIAAQQMLIMHYNALAGRNHQLYYQSLNQLGYPENLRKIAISNGSLNNTLNGESSALAFKMVFPYVLFNIDARIRLFPDAGERATVFSAMWVVLFVPVWNRVIIEASSSSPCGIDAAPGGYYNTFKQIEANAGGVTNLYYHNHSFMPINSVLDLNGFSDFCINVSHRNLVAEGKTPFRSYWGPRNKNMDHVSIDSDLAEWVFREIETYIQGQRTVSTCENQTYTVHLPATSPASTIVNWTCSDNLRIISGQGTKDIIVKGLASGEGWLRADVTKTLTHSGILKDFKVTVNSATNSQIAPSKIGQATTATWNTNYEIVDDLTIDDGATLTIRSNVYVGQDVNPYCSYPDIKFSFVVD